MTTTVERPITGRLEFQCADKQGLRDGLIATLAALDHGVEPNVLWAPGYHIAILVGGPR